MFLDHCRGFEGCAVISKVAVAKVYFVRALRRLRLRIYAPGGAGYVCARRRWYDTHSGARRSAAKEDEEEDGEEDEHDDDEEEDPEEIPEDLAWVLRSWIEDSSGPGRHKCTVDIAMARMEWYTGGNGDRLCVPPEKYEAYVAAGRFSLWPHRTPSRAAVEALFRDHEATRLRKRVRVW